MRDDPLVYSGAEMKGKISLVLSQICIVVLFLIPRTALSQQFTDFGAYMSIIVPTYDLDEGIGIGVYGDFLVINRISKGYLRIGYDYQSSVTHPGTFSLPNYDRNYVYSSLLIHRKYGYAFYPFAEAGAGYMFHRIYEQYINSARDARREQLTNGIAGHLSTGMRIRMVNSVWVNFGIRLFLIDTKKTVVTGVSRLEKSFLWKQADVIWEITIWL